MRVLLASLLLSTAALAQDPPAEATATAPAAAEAPATEAPAAETPAEPASTNGSLSVTSNVPAKVFLDGKDTGLTTPVVDFAVPAGVHTVEIVTDDGRKESTEFTMEAGGGLTLSLAIPEPEAEPADAKGDEGKGDEVKTDEVKTDEAGAAAQAPPPDDWTWMTVTGWSGLGLGTIGLLSGAVVLTTPSDPQQGPLGFGLFGAGVGLVLGGAVLLYLDNELAESAPATAEPAVAPAR